MPILWRYLIVYFFKVTALCLVSFMTILLTMKLDEIAHFAALGAPVTVIFLFALYQVPCILPLALPLSCLIASFSIMQRLSSTHELIALRACGLSLKNILTPWLLSALFLSLANFWFVSELTTYCHLKTNSFKNQIRLTNPLLLLTNKQLMRSKGFYFDSLGDSHKKEWSNDVILAVPNRQQELINLLIAKQLKADTVFFTGEQVTLISGKKSNSIDTFDDLLVENMKKTVSDVEDFQRILKKKTEKVNDDYLSFPLLTAKIKEQLYFIENLKQQKENKQTLKFFKTQLNKSLSEGMKRFSIGFAVISFTLLGASFGLSIDRDRQQKKSPLIFLIILISFYLISYFAAKSLTYCFIKSTAFYLVPHVLLIISSFIVLKRISKGKETC